MKPHRFPHRAAPAAALLLFLLAPALPAAPQEGSGEIRVFVFGADGKPRAGTGVRLGAAAATSDASGVARLQVPAGVGTLTVESGGRAVGSASVRVLARGVTEVIVRLDADGRASQMEVENPGGDAPPADPAAPAVQTAPGTLEGRLKDAKEGKPVPGARIFVRGLADEARSGQDGTFSLRLPAGPRMLSVVHPEYAARTAGPFEVPENGILSVEIELAPSAVDLPAETVRGYRIEGGLVTLLTERKEESVVSDIIGRDEISKAGDSNAASALRRVTGLTVVGGRYVYVRGMGERYSSTLLNGATLPSPQPERRVVPLDIFPVDVIESVSIRKSYSPDMPGEFGGGAVLLRTRSMPEKFMLNVSLSGGYNSESTFRKGLTYDGGRRDFLGYDDGTREIPFEVRAAGNRPIFLGDETSGEGFSAETLEIFGEAFQNVWSAERYTVAPDGGLGLTVGDKFELLGTSLGYQFGLIYDNSTRTRRNTIRGFSTSAEGLGLNFDYRSLQTVNTVNLGAILNLAWQPAPKQEIALTSLLVRTTRDRAEVYQGDFVDGNAFIRVTELDWIEEMLLSNQLRGAHLLPWGIEFDWRAIYSYANRDQPDFRRTRYDQDPNNKSVFFLSNRPEGNQRFFNELDDEGVDVGADLKVPFSLAKEVDLKARGGFGYVFRDRTSDTRRFKYQHRGPLSSDLAILTLPAEQIFSPANIGPDGFSFEEITRGTDSYKAEQTLKAFYAMADLRLPGGVEISGGARIEKSHQEVTTFNLFNPSQAQVADLSTTDVLPAINAAWRFLEGWQLRAGYSRTLSRPDFRELSEAPFDQIIGNGVIMGNPDLDRATIDNYDLRVEWYPSEDESVSLGFFHKELENPIETILIGGSNRVTTFENAERGVVQGVELEARKRLGFLGEGFRGLYVAGNLALIRSEVEISNAGIATENNRPLQGQSPYVFNLTLGYDDPEQGISLALLYNVYGERISEIGANGLPDIYEQPFHQLDIVASWNINKSVAVKLKVQNLLDGRQEFTQEGEAAQSYRRGIDASLGITWSW